ncbi:MAG: hypothetical protein UH211_00495 [Agathobacter sp.]|nr:hypothetical protein [Agathobacter sp.]
MSELFEKIEEAVISVGKEASKVAKDATQAAKDATSSAKEKIDIKSKEYDMKVLFAEIGKAYFEKHRDDEEFEYDQMQALIDLDNEIKVLKAE